MKKYIIFAGVNGAGKTTLYQTNSKYRDLPRVNMDEIVRGFGMQSFRKIASFVNGECKDLADDIPEWFEKVLG